MIRALLRAAIDGAREGIEEATPRLGIHFGAHRDPDVAHCHGKRHRHYIAYQGVHHDPATSEAWEITSASFPTAHGVDLHGSDWEGTPVTVSVGGFARAVVSE